MVGHLRFAQAVYDGEDVTPSWIVLGAVVPARERERASKLAAINVLSTSDSERLLALGIFDDRRAAAAMRQINVSAAGTPQAGGAQALGRLEERADVDLDCGQPDRPQPRHLPRTGPNANPHGDFLGCESESDGRISGEVAPSSATTAPDTTARPATPSSPPGRSGRPPMNTATLLFLAARHSPAPPGPAPHTTKPPCLAEKPTRPRQHNHSSPVQASTGRAAARVDPAPPVLGPPIDAREEGLLYGSGPCTDYICGNDAAYPPPEAPVVGLPHDKHNPPVASVDAPPPHDGVHHIDGPDQAPDILLGSRASDVVYGIASTSRDRLELRGTDVLRGSMAED